MKKWSSLDKSTIKTVDADLFLEKIKESIKSELHIGIDGDMEKANISFQLEGIEDLANELKKLLLAENKTYQQKLLIDLREHYCAGNFLFIEKLLSNENDRKNQI
jgi:hypothetical protein